MMKKKKQNKEFNYFQDEDEELKSIVDNHNNSKLKNLKFFW